MHDVRSRRLSIPDKEIVLAKFIIITGENSAMEFFFLHQQTTIYYSESAASKFGTLECSNRKNAYLASPLGGIKSVELLQDNEIPNSGSTE